MSRLLFSCALALLLGAACATAKPGPTLAEKKSGILERAGIDALEHGQFTQALTDLQDAIHYTPKSAALWTDLGVAFAGKQEDAKAEEAWKKALQLNTANTDARMNLGILYSRQKRYGEAEKILKEASKDLTYPKAGQVAYSLAMLYLDLGRKLAAEQQLRVAVREQNYLCVAWYQLAKLQEAKDQLQDAAVSLKNSVRGTCYKNPEAHFEIAHLYLQAGDQKQAKTKLLEIIQLFPESDWAKRAEISLNSIH